jgi:hypothetical protein
MHNASIFALALSLGLAQCGGNQSDTVSIADSSVQVIKTPPETGGHRLDKYNAAVRLLRDGAKNFGESRYVRARADWDEFLSLDAVREGAGDDVTIARAPSMIEKATAQSLFVKLHQSYDAEGYQRPAGMPQIPSGVTDAFPPPSAAKYQQARRLLRQAATESPKLHRIPFLLGLLDILDKSEDDAAGFFIRLTALPPEYTSPDIINFSEEQISAVRWLTNLARRRSG